MFLKLRAFVILAISIWLSTGLGSGFGIWLARGNFAPPPKLAGTQWVPAGPMIDNLQFQVYSTQISEFNSLQNGALDIADARVPPAYLGVGGGTNFQTDSRFLVTNPASQYDVYGIDFNMTNTFWGVPFSRGVDPTGRAVHIRQGIAHLISKQGFIAQSLGGFGQSTDCFAPVLQLAPPKGIGSLTCPEPGESLSPANGNITSWNVCSFDRSFPNCSSAYSLNSPSDAFGAVQEPSADFCAAADQFIAAKLAANKDPTTCVLTGLSAAANSTTVALVVPLTDSGSKLQLLGATLTNAINLLMGRSNSKNPAVADCSASLDGLDGILGADFHQGLPTGVPQSFRDLLNWLNHDYYNTAYGSVTACSYANWGISTIGWRLSQSFDQLYGVYNSKNSFNGYSDPNFDHWTNMMEFNSTRDGAVSSAQAAEYILGANAVEIPIWSDKADFVYNNGWTGVVQQAGVGPPGYWTSINAWNPHPSLPGTIRWGLSQGTVRLNVFTSLSYWDRFVMGEIYDTLLASDAYSPNTQFGWLANSFTLASPTDIKMVLNGNILWHDTVWLTASDVKFSLLTLAGNAADISDVNTISSPPGQPSIFDIILQHPSPFALFNVGSIPIIPQHIWAADPSTPCVTKGTAACSVNMNLVTGPSSDTVTNHLLIGSGPFVCVDLVTGQIGGGCTVTASGGPGTAAVDAGGSIHLQRNGFNFAGTDSLHSYFRDGAKYKLFQWADIFNIGTVNINDVSSAEACYGKPASTPGCTHWDTPAAKITCVSTSGSCNAGSLALGGNNDGRVDGSEVSEAETMFGITWLPGLSGYGDLVGAQPIPQTLYEGGVVYAPCTATPPAC